MKSEIFRKLKIPDKPGVYFFLKTSPQPSPGRRGSSFPFQGKAGDEVLYIGKATSLKDRVKSYFGKDLIGARGPILVDMVFNAEKIDWHVTDSVLEAIILEANLIKKHQPKYNTKEKSDKSFNYVVITKEKLPKVVIVRGSNIKNKTFDKVYGPFPNSSQLREAMKIVRKIFPFLDDKSKNYLEFYRQINLVPDLNDTKMYLQNIRNIKLFFKGKKKEILRNLEKEMKEYAKMHEFEKAGEIKRQLFALQHINDVALIKEQKNFGNFALGVKGQGAHVSENSLAPFRVEAYDVAHMGGKNMVGVMTTLENGEVAKNEYKKFKIRTQNRANDTGALGEILERRLIHREWTYPNLIVVDGGIAQINVTNAVLKKMNVKIPVVSVIKNDRHKAKGILGDKNLVHQYEREILLANSEAHRFAIAYHKKMRARNFLTNS